MPAGTPAGFVRAAGRALAGGENAAVPGVDFQLHQRAAAAQGLDLIYPATAVALKFDLQHLPGIAAFDALDDRPQRENLARFERLASAIVVVVTPAVGPTASGPGQH